MDLPSYVTVICDSSFEETLGTSFFLHCSLAKDCWRLLNIQSDWSSNAPPLWPPSVNRCKDDFYSQGREKLLRHLFRGYLEALCNFLHFFLCLCVIFFIFFLCLCVISFIFFVFLITLRSPKKCIDVYKHTERQSSFFHWSK